MKRIEHRSAIALLLAAALALGMGFFVVRLALYGGDWASYSANQHIYQNGVLKSSTLTDRNGVILAQTENGAWRYADDPAVRLSSVHAVGDYRGYISGAISAFSDELAGYSFVYGTPGGGTEVALSLDTRLQTAAWDALAGRRGAVLVMNYETGEILTMVSSPSYDPNGEADTSIDGLFINRCTLGTFTPGSVFKLVTLIAAVENLPDLTEQTFTCNQYLDLPGGTVVCTGWHGPQTIEQALANSCNCAFGELALELGSETIVKTAQRLGVAGSLTLDGAATASGKIETAEAGSSDEAWLGIGQYTDLVTPYSMLRLCAAIANGGTAVTPTLAYGGVGGGAVLMDAETAEYAGECMSYDVAYGYGRDRFPGLDLCAKSGTAEIGDGTTHAWFVGYLRTGAPVAFAVMLEHGGGGLLQAGGVANSVLQTVMEYYSDD